MMTYKNAHSLVVKCIYPTYVCGFLTNKIMCTKMYSVNNDEKFYQLMSM